MKNFDIRRFCAVARWDLTINRAFYNKMAMVIAACSILPVLFYHAIENLERVSDADGVGKPYSSFLVDLDLTSRTTHPHPPAPRRHAIGNVQYWKPAE